jgi:uncharacterized protein YrrD
MPGAGRVSWLRLHRGGVFGGERLWVSVAAVHGVGEDAVTINAEADARAPADAPDALALVKAKRGVIGNTVITEDGERVGEVRDYEFDPDTFALTSLSVPPGMNVVGEILMIPGDKVLTIGKDMIVVAADATMRPEVMAEVGNALAF